MERHEDAGNGLSSLSEPSSSSLNNGKQKGVENKKKEPKSVSFLKLFAFADSYDFLLMSVGSVGGIGNGVGMPLMTLLFGELIQTFGSNQDTHSIVSKVSKVCLKFVYLAVGVAVAAFLQVCCWIVTGERQAARIRGLYLKAILRQDVGYFDKETSTGEVVSRMSGDTVLIQDAMGEKVGKTVQLITNFIGGFTIAFIRGWQLALVMVSVIPLLVVAGATISRFMSQMAARGQSAYANAANVVEQTIGSIRTVASFTGEKQAISSYQKFLVDAYKSGVREALGGGIGIGTVMLVIFCTYSLAVWFGGKMIIEKGYDGGQVITIILAVLEASMSLGQILPCFSAFASGRAAASKMFETIQRKPSIDVYDPKGKTLDDIQGDIDLKDVTFSYPTRPDEAIFSGFSLHIPRGTTAALVGESGSGKSTVISLIERFYDPQSGEVLIDGVNLKEFRLRWIRAKIGLVSQEPILFTASIKDNIAYGKDDATNEEIKSACELANAAKFIDKLPQGLHTLVGEHGTQLSGGQKQRIAIARAILKDPRILLLDEATSALDAESESVVQEALDRIMVNRTTVIVAHRLSTVRNADMIAVIHRGKMVQKGSHSKLIMNPSGAYSQLIRLQETNKDSKHASEVVNRTEFSLESMRQSSQRAHCLRSISRGSSVAHSSRRSLSMFGLTSEHDLTDDCDVEGMIEEQLKAPPVSLRRLAALNKPEIPMLLMGTIGTVMCGVILPIFGLLLSNVIKTYYKPPEMLKKDTKCWAIIYIVLGVASLVAHPWRAYFFSVAGCKLIERIRSLCFEKVVHMEVSWFDEAEHSSGAIGARLSSDAASMRALVGDSLSLNVGNIATAIASLVIAFNASWELALVVLALVPLIGINSLIQIKSMNGFSNNSKSMYEEASQVANDAVGGIRTVASFSAEDKVMDMYKTRCEAPLKSGIRQGLISGIGFGVSFFFLYNIYAITFYVGARLVDSGTTTFTQVFQVFYALTMAATGITHSSSISQDTTKAKAAAASVFAILDRKSKIDPSDESGTILPDLKGEIELKHISFKYPSRPNIQIFRDLNLHIHAGKTIALVGESGSGKSTVIALLQRFYDPDSGTITIDGVEIQKLQLKWLRQQIGLVSQEPVLFNETVRANIAYGKASEEEIIRAAETANAHSFISGLQHGYETTVGERGVQLSGGQKQRVAIARAIMKNPKILLLDEATSALDAESERVVQEAVDRVMVNRTTVVVAHRLSTIMNADCIAVVRNGIIVENGKHEELITIKQGFYASLIQLHASAVAPTPNSSS